MMLVSAGVAITSAATFAATQRRDGGNPLRGTSWRLVKFQGSDETRTSARCGPGSLHDQIVNEGAMVRNFVIKDGRLFLSGTDGGGYYELEPMPAGKR